MRSTGMNGKKILGAAVFLKNFLIQCSSKRKQERENRKLDAAQKQSVNGSHAIATMIFPPPHRLAQTINKHDLSGFLPNYDDTTVLTDLYSYCILNNIALLLLLLLWYLANELTKQQIDFTINGYLKLLFVMKKGFNVVPSLICTIAQRAISEDQSMCPSEG
uniref:Uncharacterized protein n=1 Tax=Glossina palpalis gambiensis TaxID=67801 RepID=A0A1B0BET1_9MUSC